MKTQIQIIDYYKVICSLWGATSVHEWTCSRGKNVKCSYALIIKNNIKCLYNYLNASLGLKLFLDVNFVKFCLKSIGATSIL